MFYQVFAAETYRSLLSFLWWEKYNCHPSPQSHYMNVHVFAVASSPGCSNYTLLEIAAEFEAILEQKLRKF